MSYLTCPVYTTSALNVAPTAPTSNYCYQSSIGLIVTRLDTAWATWWASSPPSRTNGEWRIIETKISSSAQISSSSQPSVSSSNSITIVNSSLTDSGLQAFSGLIFFLFGFYIVHVIFTQIRRFL